jgi:hypothetical protein
MIALTPEAKLRACLAVLRCACLEGRMLGYEGQHAGLPARRAELLADLMDAVHNVPELLLQWSEVDESILRGMLSGFDRKWSGESVSLGAVFDDALTSSER